MSYFKEDRLTDEVQEPEWSDKKRYFGLPISFTHYSIADGRLFIKRGLFCTFLDEVMLFRVCDVRMVQTLWQKLFGVGTVVVYTADVSSGKRNITLDNIKEPMRVRGLISRLVETEREEKGIQSAEFLGSGM